MVGRWRLVDRLSSEHMSEQLPPFSTRFMRWYYIIIFTIQGALAIWSFVNTAWAKTLDELIMTGPRSIMRCARSAS